MTLADRLLVGLAGLSGLAGVAVSAAAAHAAGGQNLETAGRFLLIHAAALIGLAALAGAGLVHPALARAAGWALLLGVALFAGDLTYRAFRGAGLFPMAAPSGGILLMIGWALVALAALIPRG
ncbi:MAG TPA: DUF423 domain-containing protein [Beijerinckiaceae bacterium]|jgi:uncharacterized membrane protein YgdD (TMEM256/DUF423 family)